MTQWKFESTICEAHNFKCPAIEEEHSIHLKPKAYKQIKALIEKFKERGSEWIAGMEGYLDEQKKDYIIEKIVLYPQEVSTGFCEFTPEGVLQMSSNPNIIGTIHSHHSMQAVFSTTDDENNKMYNCCLVINNTMHSSGSIKVKTECGKEFIVSAKNLFVPIENYNDEITSIADAFIKPKTYPATIINPDHDNNCSFQTTVIGRVRSPEKQLCHICNYPIKFGHKSKICVSCGMEVHSHCYKESTRKCKNCHEYDLEDQDDEGVNGNYDKLARKFGEIDCFA
jgi:hypothetical protein